MLHGFPSVIRPRSAGLTSTHNLLLPQQNPRHARHRPRFFRHAFGVLKGCTGHRLSVADYTGTAGRSLASAQLTATDQSPANASRACLACLAAILVGTGGENIYQRPGMSMTIG